MAPSRSPAARLGVGYRIGSLKLLTDLVGPAFAKEILITARRFNASEAERIGLVNQTVPDDSLDETIERYCAGIAANAPLSMRASKRMIAELARSGAEGGRPRALRRSGDGLLHQRGLHRGPNRVHGEADAEIHGPLTRLPD